MVVLIIVHMHTPNFIRCYLHSTLSGMFDYHTHAYPEFHWGLFTFNPFRVVWLSFTCLPRISFGVIYIQPFQGCLIVVHMHTPNFIRCYLHSTLSGLFDCRSHVYPEFHSGLFIFNPFRVVLIVVHTHTPNFIRCNLHSTLSGLFDYRSHAYPEFHSVQFTFNPFRVVESTFVHGN